MTTLYCNCLFANFISLETVSSLRTMMGILFIPISLRHKYSSWNSVGLQEYLITEWINEWRIKWNRIMGWQYKKEVNQEELIFSFYISWQILLSSLLSPHLSSYLFSHLECLLSCPPTHTYSSKTCLTPKRPHWFLSSLNFLWNWLPMKYILSCEHTFL